MVTTLYIVRHCETDGNLKQTFQGRTDCQINSKGEKQLTALADRFREIPIDVIYTSPLNRTKMTAQAINTFHSVPVFEELGIIEINGGLFENRTWDDIQANFPQEYGSWEKDFSNFAAPDGESITEVGKRATESVMRIVQENTGKSVALVTHGGTINALMMTISGVTPGQPSTAMWCHNTGISRLDFTHSDGEITPNVVYFNDFEHLMASPETMPTSFKWELDE